MSAPTQAEIKAGVAALKRAFEGHVLPKVADWAKGTVRGYLTDELVRYAASEVLWAAHEARKAESK